MNAILLKTDKTEVEIKPEKGKRFTMEEMQKFVGGYFQYIHLPGGKFLVVNEDGGPLNLPVNEKASEIFGAKIVGNCLLASKALIS